MAFSGYSAKCNGNKEIISTIYTSLMCVLVPLDLYFNVRDFVFNY
jgi:hypothetical protein